MILNILSYVWFKTVDEISTNIVEHRVLRSQAISLPEPMLAYCQLDSWKQIPVKFESEFYHFHSWKYIWNCRLSKWRPFDPGGGGGGGGGLN